MSIFSRISKSRQQAKEHNARLAEAQKKESSKPPYRHVVTHAAIDAITSAPPSWREADRVRIKEENDRRRRNKTANHHMSLPGLPGMPGMPRVGSSLSHVSFPADANADPVVRLPRAQSYSGVPSSPYVPYLSTPHNVSPTRPTFKGKEVYRPGHETPRKGHGHGESGSSSGSTSSQDDLEMAHGRPKLQASHQPGYGYQQPGQQPGHVLYSYPPRAGRVPTEAAHRFHASQSSIDRIAMANNGRARESSRPPTAMSNRPASMGSRQDLYGQMNHVSGLPSPPTTNPPSPVRHGDAVRETDSGRHSHVRALSADLITHAPVPVHVPVRIPYEGQVQASYETRFAEAKTLEAGAESAKADDDNASLSDVSFKSAELPPSPSPSPPPAQREQRGQATPTTQTAQLGQATPTKQTAQAPANAPAYTYAPAPAVEHCIVNMFPEADLGPDPGKTKKRLSKSVKKSRWSHSRSAPVHVI